MKPVVKAILSPDTDDLSKYFPEQEDNFGILLQLLIGPENGKGMESFQVTVCTPKWITIHHAKDEFVIGRHFLIVFEYDYPKLMSFINSYVSKCVGENWQEIADKLSRFGYWEFEGYIP